MYLVLKERNTAIPGICSIDKMGRTFTSFFSPHNHMHGHTHTYIYMYVSRAPKSLQMVTAAIKLKDAYFLEGKLCPT